MAEHSARSTMIGVLGRTAVYRGREDFIYRVRVGAF